MSKPRMTMPESGNPYYNRPPKGYAVGIIAGSPQDPECDVLANCFTGDTKIITREGVVRLDSIEGKDIYVLSKDGKYRIARGEYFGVQKMYEVKLRNGDSFICTGNHRWVVHRKSTYNGKTYEKDVIKTTVELCGSDYIPYVKNEDTDIERNGIIHGFIYGDGSYYNDYRQSRANLCGYKKEYMFEFFEDAKHICEQANGVISCYPYPAEYKAIPCIEGNSLSYLRGFIAGLIASDGCVDSYGCVSISTVKADDAKKISGILSVLGYRNRILVETRDTNYKSDSTIFRIAIKKSFLPVSILLNPKHQDRFISHESRDDSYTRVDEVIDLGYEDDAYCVKEPETHTMVLDGCILTGQCVGYAAGRFNEIIGQNCFVYFQYAPNPKDWIATAKTHGLQTGTKPKLGAVLVWEKHVCIVEEIHADSSITTSESGYGCTPAFWTTHRNNSNGDWNGGGFGKFLGFIYQPENNETKEKKPMKKGIDISYCQTKVDWSKVTAEFVIARAGYGKLASQKDTMFESHYAGAKSRGIPIGAYWYSYAMDEASARAEADACIAVLKGKQFEYPIIYDVEEQKQFALGKAKVSAIIRAFLERLEAAGYWVGLYGSYSSLTTYTDEDIRKRYSIWLAHWDVQKSPYTGSYGVWQYSVGSAAGVTGPCDLDYSYVDYPSQIKAKGLNGYGKQPKPTEPTPAKKTVNVEMKIDGTTYAGTLTEK